MSRRIVASVAANPHMPGGARARAWDKGWRAFKDGLVAEHNPYPGRGVYRLEWLNGWRAAREMDVQRKAGRR